MIMVTLAWLSVMYQIKNGVVGVSVPIWSERNGQDDII